MAERAADDADMIYRERRRLRVVETCYRAGFGTNSQTIPDEVFLEAGFSRAEINSLPSMSRKWPLLESELR